MKKIILVENQPDQIDIYRQIFKKTGFDVELASSAKEMHEELRDIRNGDSERPDLVVVDFMFDDGRGVEILKAIKKSYLTRDIPVFAVTNYQNRNFEQEIERQGIMPEQYLIKAHHTPSELVGIISGYLAKKDKLKTTLS
jgi:CheY-like chemotaxis protein